MGSELLGVSACVVATAAWYFAATRACERPKLSRTLVMRFSMRGVKWIGIYLLVVLGLSISLEAMRDSF